MSNKKLHILYTVLDWGLGHATRSIPIIQYLLDCDVRVTFIGEGNSLFLLKQTFPQCESYQVKGIEAKYSSQDSLVLKMALSIPKNLFAIYREHYQINQIVKRINPDAIISDSRFGAWTKKIPCVFITHQLNIKAPINFRWLEPIIYKLNKFFLTKYSKVWVPDFSGVNNLSGELSHNKKSIAELNPEFIGPLSRFSKNFDSNNKEIYELLIIISGPEPQRNIFENQCIEQAKKLDKKTLIVCGRPQDEAIREFGKIKVLGNLSLEELNSLIITTKNVVCRSGYSSIMDLFVLQKNAICIPTPGQTEQEYIAEFLSNQKFIVTQKQSEFNLQESLNFLKQCESFNVAGNSSYKIQINYFLVELVSHLKN